MGRTYNLALRITGSQANAENDEVALALGISVGLSRVRLHRARKALSEHFHAVNLGMKHPTQFMISRYVDGDLPAGTYEPIGEHFEVCTSCRRHVAWLRDLQLVARTLRLPRPLPRHIATDLIPRRRERNAAPGD
ncbi:MAG TPA: zf-HC2 domain-containing protein [Acidimicrobiia bacterium]|nr:zf-HC2 domain-containing protein [Acidimicrobiia bacterium]